jgi:hypothetical protein
LHPPAPSVVRSERGDPVGSAHGGWVVGLVEPTRPLRGEVGRRWSAASEWSPASASLVPVSAPARSVVRPLVGSTQLVAPPGGRPYGLQVISLWWHNFFVEIDWPAAFGDWLDDLEKRKGKGEDLGKQVLILVAAALKHLQDLDEPPTRDTETATLKWVRQSKRYPVWRVSHPYREGLAVRLICWFPPESNTVVVALFAGDKSRIGDVFYNSVGSRADGLIDQWRREVGGEQL